MKIKLVLGLIAVLFLSACEVNMAPSGYWRKWFGTESDSTYYRDKAKSLVKQISKVSKEYDINKLAVLDFVNEEGRVPVLGEYLSSRLIEAIAAKRYYRVAQKGEVGEVLSRLNLAHSPVYTTEEARRIGKALHAQSLISGKITDIGTNIDWHITMTDIVTGEVIASATENLTRNRFAVEMMRNYSSDS